MPSAKAHDAITVLLAIPIFVVALIATRELLPATVIAVFSLFGGLLFSPDLDTYSKQYTRWGIFRIVWFPYQLFFRHRSRFTHGIIFGTLLRTIYLMGVLTLVAFAIIDLHAYYTQGNTPNIFSVTQQWQQLREAISRYLGDHFALLVFLGLWLGGLSHTLTDIAGTYVKTGKVKALL